MQVLLFILGLLLFIGLVVIHEWGHYIMARRNGVKVEEFGIGFPPKVWAKKTKTGMILSLNWLPLGGFVKMKGEHDSDERPGSFGAVSLSAKTKILLAGVTMNLIAALVIFTLLALIGMPKLLDERIVGQDQFTVASDTKVIHQEVLAGFVQPGSPAEEIGLTAQDTIKTITSSQDRRQINNTEQLRLATSDFAGQTVAITFVRGDREITRETRLLSEKEVSGSLNTDNPKGHLGVVPTELEIRRSTWSAPIVALGFTKQLVELTMQGLGRALAGIGSALAGLVTGNEEARVAGQTRASNQVGGPVAIGAALWALGNLGFLFLLWLIGVLSLILAIMNVLPIPALDGGRLALVLVSRGILKRPLSKTAEEKIVGTSMAFLIGLIVLITVVDVRRFF